MSQLGGPVIPGGRFDQSHSITQFTCFYAPSRTRAYSYEIKNPNAIACYLDRYPFHGGTASFRIPSVAHRTVTPECSGPECDVNYYYRDETRRGEAVSCPPEVGENVVDMQKLPGKPGAHAAADKWAGFNGYFMTTFGLMELRAGSGTIVFRTRKDNSIRGKVTATAQGWNLDGRWRDITDAGNFHFEMDRDTGNFFGMFGHGDLTLPALGPNGGNWLGQCRSEMPTELSMSDDKRSRDVISDSPPIAMRVPRSRAP